MPSNVTRLHPETRNTPDEIWKLQQAGLATPDEIRWRKREDARTDTVRPEPPGPAWKPMSMEEFQKEADGNYCGMSVNSYEEYLKGFFQEMGRRHAQDRLLPE